jgi:hypothetical protein
VSESLLIWHQVGRWKRVLASKAFFQHAFRPHIDAVESVIDYQVPPKHFSSLAAFDGSVIAERTAGEVSARCHDEQANFLALNLVHDLVTGAEDAEQARAYYAKEFLNARRKQPPPTWTWSGSASNPDRHIGPRRAGAVRPGPGTGRPGG